MARSRSIANLTVSLTARTDRFRRGMKGAQKTVSLFSAAAKAAGAAAATALVVGLKKAAAASEEFNSAMNNSLAIMGDVSKAMRDNMSRAAVEVARTTQFSARQAAESYFFLASAGLNAAQSIKALPTVSKFAQAGMFDMARATDLLTDAQSALGLTLKDPIENLRNMNHVADVLVKANTLANASVEQFSEALTTKAAAAARGYGIRLEEVVGVLSAFADQGIKGSDAGTAFNIVLRDLTTKALKNARAFKQFNIAVFDGRGEVRAFHKILRDLEDALGGMSDAARKATLMQLGFTDKSVVFLQTLIGMSDRVDEYVESLHKAGGTMKEVADKQLTPFKKGWEDLKAGFQEAANALQPLIDMLGELLTITGKLARPSTAPLDEVLGLSRLSKHVQLGKDMQSYLEAQVKLRQERDKRARELADERHRARNAAQRVTGEESGTVKARRAAGLEAITDPNEARRVAAERKRQLKEDKFNNLKRIRLEKEAAEAQKEAARIAEREARMRAMDIARPIPTGETRLIDLARTFIPGLASNREQKVGDQRTHTLLERLLAAQRSSGGAVAG